MSAYDRTAIQAVIGQKLDGQFQKLLSEHERPIQQKRFALKHLCSKAKMLIPDLAGDTNIPVLPGEGLEYVYACAEQDITDKDECRRMHMRGLFHWPLPQLRRKCPGWGRQIFQK